MSETMATRITTVSRVSRHSRVRALWPAAPGGRRGRDGAAPAGAPRGRLEPVRVDAAGPTSRPRRSSVVGGSPGRSWPGIGAQPRSMLAALVRWWSAGRRGRWGAPGAPVAGGAAAAAGLSLGLSVPTLPLRASPAAARWPSGWTPSRGGRGPATWSRPASSRRCSPPPAGAAVRRRHAALPRATGGRRWGAGRWASARGWRRWPRWCWTRSSTTSSRCPRVSCARTSWRWPVRRGSASARSTRWTPAAARRRPTPT